MVLIAIGCDVAMSDGVCCSCGKVRLSSLAGALIMGDSDSDTLAMVIAGVASVVGGLCYRLYHARKRFGELLGMVWGFIASRGAIPILNSRFLGYYWPSNSISRFQGVVCCSCGKVRLSSLAGALMMGLRRGE